MTLEFLYQVSEFAQQKLPQNHYENSRQTLQSSLKNYHNDNALLRFYMNAFK